MAQVINTNYSSLNAQRNLVSSQKGLEKTLQRLSTGLRINGAKDDAAGLGISERMTSQIRGLDQATRNANDGISMSKTAESALEESTNILQRMRELAVQSANGMNTSIDREAIQDEVTQLALELDRTASNVQFNGKTLFDGSFGTQKFQVGANANQTISISTANLRTNKYGNNIYMANGLIASGGGTSATGGDGFWGVNGVGAGSIDVKGYLGNSSGATVPGVNYGANATASSIASAINQYSNETGVTATARTEVQLAFATAGAYALEVRSDNGTAEETVTFTLSATSGADALSAAAAAINERSAKTGVTAVVNDDVTGIVLTNETGNDIAVSDTTVSNAGAVTVTKMARNSNGVLAAAGAGIALAVNTSSQTVIASGYLQLDSAQGFLVTGLHAAVASTDYFAGAATVQSGQKLVSQVDVTSFEKSTLALKTIDAALSVVTKQRSMLGAFQSRFDSVIANLGAMSENTSAARSTIRDADFASETANMTKWQILQQAGISILSQANQGPQNTLSLLR